MKYRIQIQQVFGGNWANFEEACQKAEWLEKDNIKPRSKAAALEALETQMDLYKNGAPHRVVAYYPDGTFEVLYTLSRGTPWFAAAVEPAKEHPTLAGCAAKFEDEPLYECEIPGAPGRVSRGVAVELEAISEPATGRATREIPPVTYIGTIEAVTTNAQGDVVARVELLSGKVELRDHQKAAVADAVHGMQGRFITIPLHTGKIRACKRHRPKTYKPHTLGIDTFKVTYSARCNSLEDLRRLDAQDAKVCRIEQELVQYAGKRCTPHRDRKVAKLRKILRILKRGIYC